MADETKQTEAAEAVAETPVEPTFTKKQVLGSTRKYVRYKDFFKANLKEDKTYTHAELSAMIYKTFKVKI